MYIARQLTGASLQEIGRQFGDRHHTTTLYSINKIEEMRRFNKSLDHAIDGRRYDADLRIGVGQY